MKIVPTGTRILVKPDPIETKTKSGIYIAQDEKIAQAAAVTGTVIALGELAFKEFVDGAFKQVYEPFAKVGDRIQYKRYTGVSVKASDSDEEFLLLNDNDVFSRFVEEKSNV